MEAESTERRWLDYAWGVVNCPPRHLAECERAGGAGAGAGHVDGNELRWPGYLGRRYDTGGGLLCIAHAHRQPTREGEAANTVVRRTNAQLIVSARAWKSSARSPEADAQYLEAVRQAYEQALPQWARWRDFARLVEIELGLDVTQVAFANLAKCRVPIERSPDLLVRLCQRQFPVRELVDAIQPVAVLTCVLGARQGGPIVNAWDAEHVTPEVFAWHGRNGTDARGRPISEWVPKAGQRLRELLAGNPKRSPAPSRSSSSGHDNLLIRAPGGRSAPKGRLATSSQDRAVLIRTRELMKTDEVRPAQARNYEELLAPGSPMLELLTQLGREECSAIADKSAPASPHTRARARELMRHLPPSHRWLRGVCAYAVAAGHVGHEVNPL